MTTQKKWWVSLTAGLLGIALGACGGAAPGTGSAGGTLGLNPSTPPVAQPGVAEQAILDAVNAARAQPRDCDSTHHYAAAQPLRWNAQLAGAAAQHSQDMALNGYLEADPHAGSDGSTPQQRIERAGYRNWKVSGENVAAGQTVGGDGDVVKAWLASQPHCENIMNPAYAEIGISAVLTPGKVYRSFFTQDFGAR